MSNPRPESRIKSLEQRATNIEADIVELASDTSEGLTALARDNTSITTMLNELSGKVHQGFQQTHTFIDEHVADLKARLDRIETTQAEQGKKLDEHGDLLKRILAKLEKENR